MMLTCSIHVLADVHTACVNVFMQTLIELMDEAKMGNILEMMAENRVGLKDKNEKQWTRY